MTVGVHGAAHAHFEAHVRVLALADEADVQDAFECGAVRFGANLEIARAHAAIVGAIGALNADALRVNVTFDEGAAFLLFDIENAVKRTAEREGLAIIRNLHAVNRNAHVDFGLRVPLSRGRRWGLGLSRGQRANRGSGACKSSDEQELVDFHSRFH